MKPTDTPRTDAYAHTDWWTEFRATQLCRELERELNESKADAEFQFARVEYAKRLLLESKAEVERLKEKVAERDQLVRTSNLLAKEEAKILQRWKQWGIEKEHQLKRAVEIADRYQQVNSSHYQCMCRTCRMLSELKKELK
jgi:hypothetical protein